MTNRSGDRLSEELPVDVPPELVEQGADLLVYTRAEWERLSPGPGRFAGELRQAVWVHPAEERAGT